jgi:hypothetical protein
MPILVAGDHSTLGSSLKEGLEEHYNAVDLVQSFQCLLSHCLDIS